jgi:ribose transport system ATP-binding protein
MEQTFNLFSGGNQQKAVFAKWLRNKPSLLLLDEPTQGVDIAAKSAIYAAIRAAAASGAAVLVNSADTKELAELCDRVLVIELGAVKAELRGSELTEGKLLSAVL